MSCENCQELYADEDEVSDFECPDCGEELDDKEICNNEECDSFECNPFEGGGASSHAATTV